jgi:DNA-binding MarR family transcriptional regulator
VLVTLARIEHDGTVTQRRLMDELGLTSGTISVRMDRLVDEGLVERAADPQSGRNTLISLTEQGRELFERVAPAHLENERRLLAALSDEEQDLLATLLRKLLVEFEGSRPPVDFTLRLGLTVAPAHVAVTMRQSVGLPPVAALLVRAVDEGGPSATAGLRTGDLLLSAADRELRSIGALYAAIDDAAQGGALQVEILRATRKHAITIALGNGQVPGGWPAATAGRTPRGEHVL